MCDSVANALRVFFDVIMVFDITKVGESNEDRFPAGGSTPLHTGMTSFANISRHIVVHGTTGCDPNTCEHNISGINRPLESYRIRM